jgi:Flp pilus assembly pilin Flp
MIAGLISIAILIGATSIGSKLTGFFQSLANFV